MRLLFIIDSYPPFDKGGYAQLCYDLAHEIRGRGCDVTVLCAGPAAPRPDTEPVVRRLAAPVRWGDRWPVPVQQVFLAAPRSRRNRAVFDRVVAEARPEAVLLWPTDHVDRGLMAAAESLPRAVAAYYVAGNSPTDPSVVEQYWAGAGRSAPARLARRVLRPLLGHDRRALQPLQLQHVMCVSDHERRRVVSAGVPADNACVIYNGIDLAQFPFLGLPSGRRNAGDPLRVLYAGRLVDDKGAHTLVDALAILRRADAAAAVTVTLLGAGPPEYTRRIDTAVAGHGLADAVRRRDWVARSDMPAVLADHDVLVLTTIRAEALSRAVQEAMAVGLVVVATPTGGTPEIVADGATGLIFPPGDAAALALRLAMLSSDLPLCDRLASAAREQVARSFTMAGMAEAVLARLAGWLAAKSPESGVPRQQSPPSAESPVRGRGGEGEGKGGGKVRARHSRQARRSRLPAFPCRGEAFPAGSPQRIARLPCTACRSGLPLSECLAPTAATAATDRPCRNASSPAGGRTGPR